MRGQSVAFYLLAAFLPPLVLAACNPVSPVTAGQRSTAPTPARATGPGTTAQDQDLLAQGEYLTRIGGCNDCHTPGFAESGGNLPKAQWLMGSPVGWHGPWGTTYAANLRLKVQDMDEAAWIQYSSTLHTRPPMPDVALRILNDRDRVALYRFIKSLGPGGQAAPAYLPPGEQPPIPYVDFVLPPPKAAPAAG